MKHSKQNKVHPKGITNCEARESTLGWAFTLVELIVVITILTILWTIAFVSLQWYSRDARNSARISDISNIESSLALFETKTGFFPDPSWGTEVTYSWSEVWTQWTIWDGVIENLDQLNKKPLDPTTGIEYTYSRLNTKKEYEVATVMEWGWFSYNSLVMQANAADKIGTAYVRWNYNQMIAKVSAPWTTYILAVPTIISWDITLTDIVNLLASWSLVYNWANNLPSNYDASWYKVKGWWFTYNPWNIVAYEWTSQSLEDEANRLALFQNLKTIYTWTDAINKNSEIKKIVELDESSDEAKRLVSIIVKNKINPKVKEFTSWTVVTYTAWCDWPDITYGWYTIAGCNLWTTVSWTWVGSYGWLYQWWNNYDFRDNQYTDGEIYTGIVTWSLVDTSWYWPWNYYSSPIFTSWSVASDYDWSIAENRNLWWWGLVASNVSNPDPLQEADMRWPCPEWYHIPTGKEWEWLINAWQRMWSDGAEFMNTFKLPRSWFRWWWNSQISAQWVTWSYHVSTSETWENRSHLLSFFHISPPWVWDVNIWKTYRTYAQAIRCFKN